MAIVKCCRAVAVRLSVTLTSKAADPASVGVPAITPVVEFRVSPFGRAPLMSDHEYGGVPPAAVNVWEYAAPAKPPGNNAAVTITRLPGPGAIDIVNVFPVLAPIESVTLT